MADAELVYATMHAMYRVYHAYRVHHPEGDEYQAYFYNHDNLAWQLLCSIPGNLALGSLNVGILDGSFGGITITAITWQLNEDPVGVPALRLVEDRYDFDFQYPPISYVLRPH